MGIFTKNGEIKLYHTYTDSDKTTLLVPVGTSKGEAKKKIMDKEGNLLMEKFLSLSVDGMDEPICLFTDADHAIHHSKTDYENTLVICMIISDVTNITGDNKVSDMYVAIPATHFVKGLFTEVIKFTSNYNVPITDADFEEFERYYNGLE